jgi:AraC family transcriptional regulator
MHPSMKLHGREAARDFIMIAAEAASAPSRLAALCHGPGDEVVSKSRPVHCSGRVDPLLAPPATAIKSGPAERSIRTPCFMGELTMNPVGRALWFIENHFAGDISLDDIAKVAGVSRYHVTRVFGETTGHSVMRYVRGRRLTEAARSLSKGAPDILTVALDAGYGSHEAFTRAFRSQFGPTPEAVRAQRHLDNIELVEPIKMDETTIANLQPPRFENLKPLLVAGLCERYDCESSKAIPSQWQRFQPYIGNVPGQIGATTYGVRHNSDEEGNFDYIAGVEVTDFSLLPSELTGLRIPPQTYAVFSHRDHIATIRSTIMTIWNKWLPESGHEVADAADFERYGEAFDPRTGMGGLEIWIPIKASPRG